MEKNINKLSNLFKSWSGTDPEKITTFPSAGSNRKYYRFNGNSKTAIGVIGEDKVENKAFIEFSKHFKKSGLNVPEIYKEDQDSGVYLQEDLGSVALFDLLNKSKSEELPDSIKYHYQQVLEELIKFQVIGHEGLDYSLCYPVSEFNRQSMQWDLNYFKYYFLRPSGLAYDEYQLEKDFTTLINYLEKADSNFFMYRDFQSRNIIIRDEKPWFIDYQGGRKGPVQYDIASLLFQAKANLPYAFREEMLNFYVEKLGDYKSFDTEEFIELYYGFVLMRTLQVLGAYGYRGFFEQKPYFIESSKFALQNVRWLLENIKFPFELSELFRCLSVLSKEKPRTDKSKRLKVDVSSFSFIKYGYPKDSSGHGGGFVFDCRALPNPGRYEEYKQLTGRDKPVIDFLRKEAEVTAFVKNFEMIISQAVDNYLIRGFDHLSINFGCTGGQHRSVYCAEHLYKFLRDNYRIEVVLSHKMLD